MVRGFERSVIRTLFKIVEGFAEIKKGAVVPEILVQDLHFDVDDQSVVEHDLDIENKGSVVNCLAKFDRIEDNNGPDIGPR